MKQGLSGALLTGLGTTCGGRGEGEPWEPPPPSDEDFRLTDGKTLYDDFDGNGGLQTYNGQDLAVAGALSPRLWVPNDAMKVVGNPLVGSGSAPPAGGSGNVLEITNDVIDSLAVPFVFLTLDNPTIIEFADVRSFGADVALSSASTSEDASAWLDYHTTIPEQPPGKSWVVAFGLGRVPGGRTSIFARAANVNTDYRYSADLGDAELDRWYNLRLDVITKRDDGSLPDDLFRLEFYVDGALRAFEFPIDAEILLDPERTGGGPNRSLIVGRDDPEGGAVAFFDNVRAVYKDRTR